MIAGTAKAAFLLSSDYEVFTYKDALQRIQGDPQRHVLVYFGMGRGCETWCRHVFRVGDNYYYAIKDLRKKSIAYRFTLEKI